MILSDLAIIKSYIPQQLLIGIIIAIALCFGMGSAYAIIPTVTFTGAFSIIFTLIALDESNGWERYRLSLPLSRAQIIEGRYGSILLYILSFMLLGVLLYFVVLLLASTGLFSFSSELTAEVQSFTWQAVALICLFSIVGMLGIAALVLPFTSRFGMTRAARLLPLAVIGVFFIISWIISATGIGLSDHINTFFAQTATTEGLAVTTLVALVSIGLAYAISCFISSRLYQSREF